MTKIDTYNYDDLAGKLYAYYYVQCAICQSEVPLGDRYREEAVVRLKNLGWKNTKRGYICSDCSQQKQGA